MPSPGPLTDDALAVCMPLAACRLTRTTLGCGPVLRRNPCRICTAGHVLAARRTRTERPVLYLGRPAHVGACPLTMPVGRGRQGRGPRPGHHARYPQTHETAVPRCRISSVPA